MDNASGLGLGDPGAGRLPPTTHPPFAVHDGAVATPNQRQQGGLVATQVARVQEEYGDCMDAVGLNHVIRGVANLDDTELRHVPDLDSDPGRNQPGHCGYKLHHRDPGRRHKAIDEPPYRKALKIYRTAKMENLPILRRLLRQSSWRT